MAPIIKKPKGDISVIRPVSQVNLRLRPIDGDDRFSSAIRHILRWMDKRAGRTLPRTAWKGESFELTDIGAQRTAAIYLSDYPYWAARLDDADKNIPLRTWVTEIGVGVDTSTNDVLFGARLICVTRGQDAPFERSIPGFVKAIIADGAVELDDIPIPSAVRVIKTENEIEQLVHLLESPNRQADVILFTPPETGDITTNMVAASAQSVHDATLGAAHVFVLTDPASYFLTGHVGRELSVFRGAVRTYRPGFRAWVDEPSRHPIALPHRISNWANEGPAVFEQWLANQAIGNLAHAPGREESLPGFNTVRQLASKIESDRLRKSGGSNAELLRLFEQDNEQLRRELNEQKEQYDGLLVAAEEERELAAQTADSAKALALERLYRVRVLEKRLTESSAAQTTPIPDTLSGFEEWCSEHLSGFVEIANRAFQGIRKSEFHDPAFIYRALLLLRDFYVPMRTEPSPERRQAYEDQLQALQLEDSATGEGVNFSRDLYSVQYGGTRRSLDRHLKGRDARDPRFCFRLYFFWDDESQIAVVGWLPSHLTNRAS